MADLAPYDKEGQTAPLLGIQQTKLEIDKLISIGDETTPQEIKIYTELYDKLDECGDTDGAKTFSDIIEGVQRSSAELQKHRRHATQEIARYASRMEQFKQEDADTTKKMKGDI